MRSAEGEATGRNGGDPGGGAAPTLPAGGHRAGQETPYATSAHAYLKAGWNPLPILDMGKGQVPAGFTGYAARTVTTDDVARWIDQQNLGTRSVCLRLMYEVGIDIDSYDDTKNARGDWEALVAEHGEPPPTVRVSSRFGTDYDDLAGIKIYRLPASARSLVEQRIWKGQLGSGIDVIRLGHRQVVAWPSLHPARGTRYQYLDERTGQIFDGPLPPVPSLPELSEEWVQVLIKPLVTDSDGGQRRRREYHDGDRSQWWTDGPPCQAVNTALGQIVRTLPGGHHDGAKSGLLRLTRLGEQGHTGVQRAVDQLLGAFLAAVDGTRSEPALEEWNRMVTDLDALIDADGLTPEDKRGCCPGTDTDAGPPALDVTNQAIANKHLRRQLGTGPTAGVFTRAGQLVFTPHVDDDGYRPLSNGDDDEDSEYQVRPMSGIRLAAELDHRYAVFRRDKDGVSTAALAPLSVCNRLVAAPENAPKVRKLTAVTRTPFARPDWTICTRPGYDKATGVLYLYLALKALL